MDYYEDTVRTLFIQWIINLLYTREYTSYKITHTTLKYIYPHFVVTLLDPVLPDGGNYFTEKRLVVKRQRRDSKREADVLLDRRCGAGEHAPEPGPDLALWNQFEPDL